MTPKEAAAAKWMELIHLTKEEWAAMLKKARAKS